MKRLILAALAAAALVATATLAGSPELPSRTRDARADVAAELEYLPSLDSAFAAQTGVAFTIPGH
jgi:hypothetical protein